MKNLTAVSDLVCRLGLQTMSEIWISPWLSTQQPWWSMCTKYHRSIDPSKPLSPRTHILRVMRTKLERLTWPDWSKHTEYVRKWPDWFTHSKCVRKWPKWSTHTECVRKTQEKDHGRFEGFYVSHPGVSEKVELEWSSGEITESPAQSIMNMLRRGRNKAQLLALEMEVGDGCSRHTGIKSRKGRRLR